MNKEKTSSIYNAIATNLTPRDNATMFFYSPYGPDDSLAFMDVLINASDEEISDWLYDTICDMCLEDGYTDFPKYTDDMTKWADMTPILLGYARQKNWFFKIVRFSV